MVNVDLDTMSLAELKDLQKAVNKAVDTFEERKKLEARQVLEEKAREMGFNLNELIQQGKRTTKRVNPPKYRHSENPELTWSGRGRQPAWIKEIIESGGTLDDYLI